MIVPIILRRTDSQTRVISTLNFSKSTFWKRDQYQRFVRNISSIQSKPILFSKAFLKELIGTL